MIISKFIQVSAVACALALGGTAGANNNGGTQSQGTQQQQQGQQQNQQAQNQQTQPQQQNNLPSVQLTALDQNQIKELQTRLKDVGFYRGQVDGVLGNMTRGALVSYFQSQASLVQQGRISDQALSGFGFGANDIQRVRGVDQNGNNNNNTNNNNNNNNTNNNGVSNDRQNTNGQQ